MATYTWVPLLGTTSVYAGSGQFAIRPSQKIVFDGDSVTAGNPDATFRWQVPFQTWLTAQFTSIGKTGPTYASTAVGGNTTADCLTNVANVNAQSPDHVIIMVGLNDHFNHGGTAIPPATSASNTASYIAAVKASRPNCLFHYISGLFYNTENWPDGVGSDDSLVVATMTAMKAQVIATANCEWWDIRTPIYSIDAPANNPGHAASGILTQDGTHPSKPLGQNTISGRVEAFVTVGYV